jgi:hypothetical protein
MADKKIALDLEINIKKGDMTLGELSSQLENLGGTIQEQKDILIEFERELLELQAIQSQTAKNDFSRQTQLKEKSDELKGAIKDQRLSIRELSNERTNASGALKDLTKESVNQTKVIQGLDKLTGGMATKVIKLYKGFGEGARAVKGFNAGLSNMKKALIATGIGALVVALGLVVAYWDDIIGLVNGVSGEQTKLLAETEKTNKANQDNLAATEASENSLKLQGLSEKEILDLKIKQTDEVIASTELLLEQQESIKKSQLAAAERNQKIAQGIIGFISAPISILLGTVDAISAALVRIGAIDKGTDLLQDYTKGAAKMLGFDPEEVKTKGEETAKETENQLRALKNKRDGFVIKGQEDAKKASDKKASDKTKSDEKAAAEQKRIDEETIAKEKEKQKALEDIRQGSIATEAQRRQDELNEIDKYYQSLIESAEKYNRSTEDLEIAREAKKQEFFDKEKERTDAKTKDDAEKLLKTQEDLIKTLEFKQEQDDNDFELRRAEVARREALLLADDTLTKDQRLLLEQQFAAESKKIDQEQNANRRELSSQRLQMAGDILGAINGLAQAFAKDDEAGQRKAFKLNKAAGIGQAIISTAVGINNAFVNPLDVASGVAFLKAGVIASSGIAQIATISKTQFQGGANTPPPPPTLGSGGAGAAPIGFTANLNTTQVPTTKVIVTETDIRRATRNIDGIYNKAVVVE